MSEEILLKAATTNKTILTLKADLNGQFDALVNHLEIGNIDNYLLKHLAWGGEVGLKGTAHSWDSILMLFDLPVRTLMK